jgi:TrmH family RNA methyltransferase
MNNYINYISSPNNQKIKSIIKIINNPNNYFNFIVVEGLRACNSFLESQLYEQFELFIVKDFDLSLLKTFDINKIFTIDQKIMNKISAISSLQKILGIFKIKDIYNKYEFNESTFVLYNIQDPGNLGTIIRTAVALNRKSIILINGCNFRSSKVVQSSAGMISKIKIIEFKNFEDFLQQRNINKKIFCLDINGKNVKIISKNNLEKGYFVLGNEGNGIPEDILNKCDFSISIKMSNECESLNVAITAGIIGYYVWGQL